MAYRPATRSLDIHMSDTLPDIAYLACLSLFLVSRSHTFLASNRTDNPV